ncbi:lipoprotein insertase outer membrane protein LolB [Methylobacter sp. S3L5C]|uniref:lipoprotein insertase outer membrane protein LolB n=1 Tax=Methylobacter sp. S3L5C TaxID=2839024 RepID=UPI001FAC1B89|nr:lipoprotein insertase outer membrane protein LolB [Methylobacter sp. S3L5C]UOA09337.1 lipoprotein insertase outer membrane protein LolB [Methylobacter sp. S3L5C]
MSVFEIKWLGFLFVVLMLSACTSVPVATEVNYSKLVREHLYKLERWSFEGRLALTGKNDNWQANINWSHRPDDEEIKLSGPLGQGATVIKFTGDLVTIDRGDGKAQSSTRPEAFINQQLGMFVPVNSLRYWVIGLPEPSSAFVQTATGFRQAGWLIEYKQMQAVDNQSMPCKITVTNEQVKLKLVIDQWVLNVAKAI